MRNSCSTQNAVLRAIKGVRRTERNSRISNAFAMLLVVLLLISMMGACAFDNNLKNAANHNSDFEKGIDMDFEEQIAPFFWMDHDDGTASVSLYAREGYKKALFKTRRDEGFTGTGDDWTSLAVAFIDETMPENKNMIEFDPEQGMFSAYSSDIEVLKEFILAFKIACEDDDLIRGIFAKAEPEEPLTADDFSRVLEMFKSSE